MSIYGNIEEYFSINVLGGIMGSRKSNNNKALRYASLDGVRGMAFIFVFLGHLLQMSNIQQSFILGKVGVWLFFVLSAFLLTSYFISQPAKALIGKEWLNYALRRVCRIYPLYVVILSTDCIAFKFLIHDFKSLLNHILLLEGQGHFWTIPVEMKYYAMLPIVVLFLIYVVKLNPKWAVLFLVGLLVVHYFLITYVPQDIKLVTYLPLFLVGSVAAVIQNYLKEHELSLKLQLYFDVFAVFMLAGMLFIMPICSLFIKTDKVMFPLNNSIGYGVAWGIFIISVLNGKGFLRKIFELTAIRKIGQISFGAYLLQSYFIFFIAPTYFKFPLIIKNTLIIVLTYSIAYILHITVEKQFQKVNMYSLKNDL